MGRQAWCGTGRAEPVFDLPPQLGRSVERRLAGRATADWLDARDGDAMPVAAAFPAGDAMIAGHGVALDLADPAVIVVTSVGAAVAAAFGIRRGPIDVAARGSLAACLVDAVATARQSPAAVTFAGVFAAPGAAARTFLTRGVVLPLADPAGGLTAARVVVAWKELLPPRRNRALRRELHAALAGFAPGSPANDPFDTSIAPFSPACRPRRSDA